MSGVATAIGVSAGLSYIGGRKASKEQSGAISDAAATEAQASMAAIRSQEEMFERMLELQAPFREAGLEALPGLQELSTMDYTSSPMYRLQQEEGEEAINRAAAARGGFGDTATVERLGEFTRRLGASESDKQYGRLLDLVNIGRGATTETGRAAMSTGAGISGIQQQSGANLANLQMLGGQQRASTYANMYSLPLQMIGTMGQAGVFDKPA